MNGVRHRTEEVRVRGLNSVLEVEHCASIARAENIAYSFTFYIKE